MLRTQCGGTKMGSEIGQGFDNPLHKLNVVAKYPLTCTALPKDNGVYAIVNIKNGNFYIGSAADAQRGFWGRFKGHRRDFKNGLENGGKNINGNRSKQNQRFQNAYNFHGKEAFEIWILIICEPKDCITWEQYFFDVYQPEYNACPIAGNTLGCPRSQEFRDGVSKRLEQPFSLYHRTLGLIEGINLTKYCRDTKEVDQRGLQAVASGKKIKYKDYFRDEKSYIEWKAKKDATPQSIHRGVSWVKHAKMWAAKCKSNGKQVFSKYSKNELEAAEIALIARQVYEVK
jgi:group I intron endonuclease